MSAPDFRQHLEVETPEHVLLDYEVAGLGSRALAALADMAIVTVVVAAEVLLGAWLAARVGPVAGAVTALAAFATAWGYFTLFEGLSGGRTPGKKWLGLRVIRDTGHAITFRDAAARNLLRIADFLPPPYLIGALFVAIDSRARRLGDLVAGTVVVRDRPIESAPLRLAADRAESNAAPVLSDEEFRVLREYVDRAAGLPADVRARLRATLMQRVAARFPARHQDDDEFLASLAGDEAARRRGRFGVRRARAAPGEPGLAPSRGAAERLVARQASRWLAFEATARRATDHGLDSLAADELPAFAAGYREVAADLARARTYGAEPMAVLRLERLVAAGHNVLYRADRQTWRRVARFIAVDAPGSVYEARRAVLIAFLSFAVPAFAGWAALRARPELAEQALPSVLLERAGEGVGRARAGLGYAEVDARRRPFVASAIITNNVQVAFVCFAGGIFLAVGSLLSLAFNGLLIGAASGHYQNLGLLAYLWTFVAGHGVLELFAIWCAGAAGFLLGSAIVRPGQRSRRDALVHDARLAMRLVGLAVVLLLVAGSIEGFVSTSRAGAPAKVLVSVASAALLAAYLAAGARAARRRPSAP